MRKALILIGLAILLALVFIPQIASTRLGKPYFVQALEQKSKAEVEIGSLKLSWFGPQILRNVTFKRDAITGSFEELQIIAPFWSFSGPFQLKQGQISYLGGQIENIEGQIDGNDFSLTGIPSRGRIACKGQIYSKRDFHIQIDVERFPLVIVGQRVESLLGPALDLYGTVSMEEGKGPLDLKATSANLTTHIKGTLTPGGIALEEPLNAAIRLTPEWSALLLKDANPLFITGLSADSPIRLTLEPNGFFFPLPFSLEALKVGKASLDLGKVRCQNGQTLATILALLKFDSANQMDVWFTPVSFQIDRGILQSGRLEALLANSLHVCTWGNIDLLRNQLNMTLGIPADTLKQTFGIKNLPQNYVLKLALRGTTQSPEIDKGAAVAKIAALIAAAQIPKKGILGGFAELFSKKEEADTPPPHRPFPWKSHLTP